VKPPVANTKPTQHVRPGLSRPPTAEERRRAQRVLLKMPVNVLVVGKSAPVQATTHTVSQNGAMIIFPEALPEGTKMVIENPKSQKTVEARVARPPQVSHEGALVPVEFLVASPNFWNVFFPPVIN
jgi:hypothetical protein